MSSGENHFFIVGAQRCGTTYLYHVLDEHPEICMAKPVKPEPKFFLDESCLSIGYPEYRRRYFAACSTAGRVFGEKSTSYIESDEAIGRIHAMLPKSKLLVILRDPVERAISNYWFSRENGLEVRTPEEVFLKRTTPRPVCRSTSVSPFAYLERGEYASYLKRLQRVFVGGNVKVLIHEEFVGRRESVGAVYRFLDVDSGFVPACLTERINRRTMSGDVDDEEIVKCLEQYYKPHIEELEQFLGRDLSVWRTEAGWPS